ncbi:MAG: GNAT family N-acetyltransferase [Reyranella sp.]|uniref:GNAT family N-acetyltransferase n=1 Tax=Reyranella sp. TaxID=1929291 RepID=UPI00120684AE|nr:GNAT family N-acetyltransferase [Reyranella sp.]TAJ41512.1 MAG: GNAT family N-acetyltransferase [Reyranella sp.]
MTTIELRTARPEDRDFLQALSPRLSSVPGPAWHDLAAMEGFQARYMAATFAAADDSSQTLIAWSSEGRRLGYVHMRPAKDGVTEEPCGYVSLLAVDKDAEGSGVATRLMAAAEDWARARGYRFLSLDVFADNRRAVDFYKRGSFEAETLRMVKPL